jgi:hypothetical protein
MQLATALRGPTVPGPLAGRLREVSNKALWALMVQWYEPAQQVQAIGSESDVRALAIELLDRITAGDAAGSG